MSHFRNHPWQLLWRPSFGSRSSSTPNIAGTSLAPALPMQVGAGKAVDGGTTRSSWDKPRIWPEKASNCHVGLCFKGASLSFSSVFPHWVPAPKGCQRGRQVLGAGKPQQCSSSSSPWAEAQLSSCNPHGRGVSQLSTNTRPLTRAEPWSSPQNRP